MIDSTQWSVDQESWRQIRMDWVIQKRDQWIKNTQACLKFSFFMFGGAIFRKWSIIYKYFLGWSYVIWLYFWTHALSFLSNYTYLIKDLLYFLVMSKYSRVLKEKKKWMSNCLIVNFSLDFFTWIDILLFELDSSPSS